MTKPDSIDKAGRFQFTTRKLLIVVLVSSGLLAASNAFSRFAISANTADRIHEGMTKRQVLDAAGKPHYIGNDGMWDYRVWNGFVLYSDPLHVGFDENGRVDVACF